jgi:anti-sigma factor RsiW
MHVTEDDLLKFALETCDDAEAREIREHLASCDTCRERLEALRSDIATIAGVRPEVERISLPSRSRHPSPWRAFVRMAAVLLIGFVGGLAVSHWACRCPVTVVPPPYSAIAAPSRAESLQTITPAPPVDLASTSRR